MSDNNFVDSNIAIYALDSNSEKGHIAMELLRERPWMSTQVIMESVNVLIKKLGFSKRDAFEHARFLIFNSKMITITDHTLILGFDLSERYGYNHWDSLIIAPALDSGCSILYSEDLKDGHVIQGMTIRNPFVNIQL
jgi:predicted nucleic acid-binding protein